MNILALVSTNTGYRLSLKFIEYSLIADMAVANENDIISILVLQIYRRCESIGPEVLSGMFKA